MFFKKGTAVIVAIALVIVFILNSSVVLAEETKTEVVINEVCSGNNGGNGNLADAVDSEGKFCDWIELYNTTSQAIDLSGWGISDKKSTPFKTTLPKDTIINAKDFLIIYCSKTYTYIGTGEDKNVFVPINISGDGENILISKPAIGDQAAVIVDQISVPELAKDTTFGCYPDSDTQNRLILNPTPKKSNMGSETIVSGPVFSHETGIYSDTEKLDVTLKTNSVGSKIYYTTDSSDPSDTGVLKHWDSTHQNSYGYILEFENVDEVTAKSLVETQIASAKDFEISIYKTGNLNNHSYVSIQVTDMIFEQALNFANSISTSSGKTVYLCSVSSLEENDLVYSISGMGFYLGAIFDDIQNKWTWSNSQPFSFSLFNEEEGIDKSEKYITYGTVVNRLEYTSNVSITNKTGLKNVLATDVGNDLDKGTVLKAVVKYSKGNYSKVVTKSYFVGSTFASSDYKNIGIVSLSTDFNSLDSGTYGINKNYSKKGREWEREAHFDFINEKGNFKLGAECGIRISGAASRASAKKSFRLYARADYGDKYFNYSFFEDSRKQNGSKVDRFKSLTLRSGANDAMNSFYTDTYLQKLLSQRKSFDTQEGICSWAFLNGELWGLYVLQENYDATYFEQRYDVDADDVLVVKNGLDIITGASGTKTYNYINKVEEGEDEDISYFNELIEWFKTNGLELHKQSVFDQASKLIDLENFSNYVASQLAIGNSDWCNNNVSMWRTKSIDPSNPYSDGRWRFNMFDVELSTYNYAGTNSSQMQFWANNYLNVAINSRTSIATSGSYNTAGGFYLFYILNNLVNNTNYADYFSGVYQNVMNVTLNNQNANLLLTDYTNRYNSLISGRQRKRWSGTSAGGRVDQIKKYLTEKPKLLVSHFNQTTKLNLVGKSCVVNISSNNNAIGRVYLNDNLLNFDIYNNKTFTANFIDDLEIELEARPFEGYKFVGWQGSVRSFKEKIKVSPLKASNVQAVFIREDEYLNELNYISTPLIKKIQKPDIPSDPIYIESNNNLNSDEKLVATIFNSNFTKKKIYFSSETGEYKTDLAAFDAAKNEVLKDEILRLECDVQVTGLGERTTYWTVPAEKSGMIFDVNGYSLSCSIYRVNAINISDNTSFSIINSAQKGTPQAEDKVNINFTGDSYIIRLSGSADNKATYSLTLKGVKIKGSYSSASIIQIPAYKYNHKIDLYRSYIDNSSVQNGISSGGVYGSIEINSINSVILKNSINFTKTSNTKNVNLYDSQFGNVNSSYGDRFFITLSDSTIGTITENPIGLIRMSGNSSVEKITASRVIADNQTRLYYSSTKEKSLTNRDIAIATPVYSFDFPAILGDVNDDGLLNAKDILILRRHAADWQIDFNLDNADSNADKKINAKDILVFRKTIANLN